MILTFNLLTPKSIEIINGTWLTKTPIIVSLSLIGFKLLSRQGFYVQGQGHSDIDLLTPKSIGIINGSWPTKRHQLLCS